MQIIKVEELPVTKSPRGPRIRKVLSSDDVAITNVILDPGEVLPAHVTPVDVFFYVRSGSGIVTIGDEQAEVSEGDIILSPKGIPHGLKAYDAGRRAEAGQGADAGRRAGASPGIDAAPGTNPDSGNAGPFSVLVVKTPNPERMSR